VFKNRFLPIAEIGFFHKVIYKCEKQQPRSAFLKRNLKVFCFENIKIALNL